MLIQKVFATGTNQVSTNITNPLPSDFTDLGDVFAFAINLIIGVGWALVFVMLALGFVQYITSRGEKESVESAQKWLTYAVIGGVGLFFISFLRTVITNLFGGGNLETGGGLDPFN